MDYATEDDIVEAFVKCLHTAVELAGEGKFTGLLVENAERPEPGFMHVRGGLILRESIEAIAWWDDDIAVNEDMDTFETWLEAMPRVHALDQMWVQS